MIELVYQLQLFNKKIISALFKTHENVIYNTTETRIHNVYFWKYTSSSYLALFHVWFLNKHSLCAL